jgi:Flp pilus assembly protein TadD
MARRKSGRATIGLLALLLATPALAAEPAPSPAPQAAESDRLAQIRSAIDGDRLIQAELMLKGTDTAASATEILLLADLRTQQHRYDEALALYAGVEAREPQNRHAIAGAGLALIHLGRSTEAEPRLRKASEMAGADWRTWNALGIALDRRADWEGSRLAYEKALPLAPRPAVVLNNAAYSLMLQKRPAEARALLDRAKDLEPANPQVLLNLQIADGMVGRYPPTRGGKEESAAWATRLNNVGYGAMLAGDLAGARSLFSRAIAANETRYEAAERNLARVESELNN